MLAPLGLAYIEIRRLAKLFPVPQRVDLFLDRPATSLPGAILLVPLFVWIARRLLGRLARRSRVWGVERPALETWTAILAFAPAVGWLGNPAWWREALPRLAHYYAISTARRGVLPEIKNMYFGQIYEYSLPWHNAWAFMGLTVPIATLVAAVIGLGYALRVSRSDRLPIYFLLHLVTLPVMRMLPTPAHDGVRLFLPSFFFLSAFAGWGVDWLADGMASLVRGLRGSQAPAEESPSRVGPTRSRPESQQAGPTEVGPTRRNGAGFIKAALTMLLLGSSAWSLIAIHPYELSYYNALIGGPKGAWKAGFELSYWYDALNEPVLKELNDQPPARGAAIEFARMRCRCRAWLCRTCNRSGTCGAISTWALDRPEPSRSCGSWTQQTPEGGRVRLLRTSCSEDAALARQPAKEASSAERGC